MTSVKRRLTPKRERELPEYCAMVRRELDTAIATAVQGQRRNGFSWADIGRGLGVTRQAAHMTWGPAVEQLEHAETRAMLKAVAG